MCKIIKPHKTWTNNFIFKTLSLKEMASHFFLPFKLTISRSEEKKTLLSKVIQPDTSALHYKTSTKNSKENKY